MATPEEPVRQPLRKNKCFVPLENNPEVLNHLARQLGLSSALTFYDVYSIDEPSLLALVPRPAHALIFTAPSPIYAKARQAENNHMSVYSGFGPAEPVIWYEQTIGHACGLMAVLHALSNGVARAHIDPGSLLDKFIGQAVPLAPEQRAQLLYDSQALEAAHSAAAQMGSSVAPPAEDENFNHYICFVKAGGHLWELNGGMKGPVDRGALEEDEDVLSEAALEVSVKSFLKVVPEVEQEGNAGYLGFSMVALSFEAGQSE